MQSYRVDVGVAQVIIGNEVLLKCDIPSFATDYVSVSDWVDSEGFSYSRENNLGKSYLKSKVYTKFRESTCKKIPDLRLLSILSTYFATNGRQIVEE